MVDKRKDQRFDTDVNVITSDQEDLSSVLSAIFPKAEPSLK
ncbi:MAG: hypothetical protein R2877_06280 [Bdellovibrionota bacterium]